MIEQGNDLLSEIWRYSPMVEVAASHLPVLSSTSPPIMTYCYRSQNPALDVSNWETTPGDGDICVN